MVPPKKSGPLSKDPVVSCENWLHLFISEITLKLNIAMQNIVALKFITVSLLLKAHFSKKRQCYRAVKKIFTSSCHQSLCFCVKVDVKQAKGSIYHGRQTHCPCCLRNSFRSDITSIDYITIFKSWLTTTFF